LGQIKLSTDLKFPISNFLFLCQVHSSLSLSLALSLSLSHQPLGSTPQTGPLVRNPAPTLHARRTTLPASIGRPPPPPSLRHTPHRLTPLHLLFATRSRTPLLPLSTRLKRGTDGPPCHHIFCGLMSTPRAPRRRLRPPPTLFHHFLALDHHRPHWISIDAPPLSASSVSLAPCAVPYKLMGASHSPPSTRAVGAPTAHW
jgi:hypothetical protein